MVLKIPSYAPELNSLDIQSRAHCTQRLLVIRIYALMDKDPLSLCMHGLGCISRKLIF